MRHRTGAFTRFIKTAANFSPPPRYIRRGRALLQSGDRRAAPPRVKLTRVELTYLSGRDISVNRATERVSGKLANPAPTNRDRPVNEIAARAS
jgi:hypothetical protein